jgi:hypothetical protein
MQGPNIDLYCNVMEEIKRRVAVVHSFTIGESKTIYRATTIESLCLQIRKILELIALGSLVANKFMFVEQNEKFEHLWNARLILKDIERINPKFYPKPIKEAPSKDPSIVNELIDLTTGYLTQEKFIKVYEKCGKILHADNPFGSKTVFDYYDKQIPIWLNEIMSLLNNHKITLLNDENMYVIHMKEDRDDRVHGYTFAPVKG